MKPKKTSETPVQLELERQGALLERIIDPQPALVKLAGRIHWKKFEELFSATFHPENGRPGLPTHLRVGRHYLKYACDVSDEEVLATWLENPYGQYFCGSS